ncbi:MAG: DMT family transporter [Nocardioidaceae bacterium]
MSVVLSLLSSVLWGSADFGGGLLSRRLPSYAVVGVSQAFGLVTMAVVAALSGGFGEPLGWVPWAVMAGSAGAVGLVCFYTALGIGTMGVVSPIAALGAIVPVVVGVASGEQPSMLAAIGVLLALGGAVAASGPELRGDTGSRPVVLAALAGVGFGLALLFIAKGAEHSSLMTLVGMRTTSVTAFAVAALVVGSVGGVRATHLPSLAAVGIADATANLVFAVASQMGLISVTSVLSSLYPVTTVLLAWGFLHERLLRIQQVGVAAALAGVALVSLG